MKPLPFITVMIVTLNNESTLEECLKRVEIQDYPKDKIQYLLIDGGSTDNTKKIAQHYGWQIIDSPIKRDAEAQRGIGLKKAKHDLIVSLDADNFLPDKRWFKQMIKPFLDNQQIVHANTMFYGYNPQDSLFNRYVGLFGMADPVVYYVGRPDRLPLFETTWKLGQILEETDTYYVVRFDKNTLPTVGCNGVVYRKSLLQKYAKSSPKEFLHIDVFVDLINAGFDTFVVVKNNIFHHTAVTITRLIQKRLAFLDTYYLTPAQRRYLIYDPKKFSDKFKLFLFIFYTVTFIKPLLDSFRGYLIIRDVAWFVHPIVCWIYLITYGVASIKKVMR